MFLCAISNNNREQYNGSDVASVFTTNLSEPMKLKDFTIELVDCIITAENLITITQRNNTFVFRVGGDAVSEQYEAIIPTGRYKPAELGNVIVEQLKELTPIAGWVSNDPNTNPTFSWSIQYNVLPSNVDKFVIEYNVLPTHSNHISDKIVDKNIDIGYESVITEAGSGSECNYVNNFNNNTPNNIPDVQSFEPFSFEGLNVGNNAGTTALTSFNNLGIAESGGAFEVILKPMLVCKTSSYCSTDLAIATNEVKRMNYFVIEDNTAGTAYDSTTYTDSFLNPRSKTTLRTDKQGKKYCSGLIIDIPAGNDNTETRGLPYSRFETSLIFPTRDDVVFDTSGNLTENINRIEIITSTWNNNILVAGNRHSTTTTNTWNNLEGRAFNLTLDNATGLGSTNAEASSTLKFYDETQTEPITMRLAVEPLIAGLKQGINTTNQSYITATGGGINQILTPGTGSTGPFRVVYKTGVVGQYNTPFGNPSRLTTNLGGVSERKPYYMITELDGNNVPSKIITMDGGENMIANQNLYLNDPATFDIFVNGVLTDLDHAQAENFINALCPFINPSADVIGSSVSAYATKYQYMPTELSTINDLIYNSVDVNDGLAFNVGASFAKDCEFNLIPLDSEQTDPNASINFTIDAFIPNNTDYSSEQDIVRKFQKRNYNWLGATRLIDCNPSNWSDFTIDKTGSSRTLTDWRTFVQNDVDSRLKLIIKIDNYYKFSCTVAYSLDAGASFIGGTTILETFETATETASGITYPKFECTSKSRLYPMHPAISTYPGSGFNDANQGINNITIKNSSLARYSQKVNGLEQNISNYSFKLGNIPNGSQNTPSIFTFPNDEADLSPSNAVVNLAKPPIMIKFGGNLTAGATSFAGIGILPALDIPPAPLQVISETIGFGDSYFAETNNYTGNVLSIDALNAPFFKPAINTFVVELANFPAEGFITFGFDRNTSIQSGLGNSSQIVGVVPFLVDRDINTTISNDFITLQYSTPYSQPVKVELPTEQFLYNFDFRLRDITTGKYVSGLLNPTQLIFRIQKM